MAKSINKKKGELVPGTIIECQSGIYLAFYEHRTDVIANGDSENEAKKNLKKLYTAVIKHENQEEQEKEKAHKSVDLPKNSKTKQFTEMVSC